ncbi:response regulator [Enterococcus casseliflavus]|uniref:response regulator n=1 Tax=Enterococcus casseliflavus TaxID=37734 RepID=UPI0035DB3AA4
MYRLLLADDSYDQREVIKYFLSQHEKEWLIEEAKNGREAWQLFQKQPFDLIITDVKMPFMDGHALVARIKEAVPEIPVMFISGFEDFHYVKKAIQLQAVDYLLKPIDPDDFYEQINKIILFIDQQKQRSYTKTISQTHYLKEILSKLFYGYPWHSLPKEEQSVAQDFFKTHPSFFLVTWPLDSWNAPDFVPSLSAAFPEMFSLFLAPAQLLFFNEPLPKREIEERKNNLTTYFSEQFQQKITLFDSGPVPHHSGMYGTYHDLLKTSQRSFYQQNKGKICQLLPGDHYIVKKALFEKTISYVNQYESKKAHALVKTVFDCFETNGREEPTNTKFYFATFYQTIIDQCTIAFDAEHGANQIGKILEAPSLQLIADIFDALFRYIHDALLQINGSQSNDYVRQVKSYIFAHFHQELSLERLAKEVNINPNYLSELFSTSEGMGITKYIKSYRIKQAQKRLKNSNCSIRTISKQVGFNHYSYFCKTFREIVGMTPDAYRKRGPSC